MVEQHIDSGKAGDRGSCPGKLTPDTGALYARYVVFSSPIFLFIFLPLVLAGYFATRGRVRNLWLLGTSLVFYGWGEPRFVLVMLASIAANFGFGLWLDRRRGRPGAKVLLGVAVALNLGLLVTYKYAAFLAGNANAALTLIGAIPMTVPALALPLGISFYTFHALSYLVDVSRRAADGQRDPTAMASTSCSSPSSSQGPSSGTRTSPTSSFDAW